MGRGWTMIQNIHQNQQKWFTDHKIKVLPWPSQFPDWNPIEKLLGELKPAWTSKWEGSKKILYGNGLRSLTHVFSKLISQRRFSAVILAKGGSTKY